MQGLGVLIAFGGLALALLAQIVKVLKEYEKGVVFTLGRVGRKAAGPGLVLLIPVIQQMRKVDMPFHIDFIFYQHFSHSKCLSKRGCYSLY